jgi:hypothetical protein
METICYIICIILLLILFTSSDEDKSLEELEQELDIPYKDRFHNKNEPQFYHPVTGYKGTKSEMDAYIVNREKKLKND